MPPVFLHAQLFSVWTWQDMWQLECPHPGHCSNPQGEWGIPLCLGVVGITICYVLVAILVGNAFSTRQNVLDLRMFGIA